MLAPKPISHVILDLDGTLLNTGSIVSTVLKTFLATNGKTWDSKKAHELVGKTPYEAAAVVLEDYGLPYSTEEFLSMIAPMFSEQWCNLKPLPGANRLLKHLRSNGVPTALASNSPRSNIVAKISCHQGWKESFSAIVGGDEVEKGKPSPDIFLEAAKRMNATPSNCLVIEDSLPGVAAGKAAGMHVIAVPSVPKNTAEFSSADEVIDSLLDLRPERWGLPPFNDWIEGTLPIEPWFISGSVIKGFGRGSKVLGIPTVQHFASLRKLLDNKTAVGNVLTIYDRPTQFHAGLQAPISNLPAENFADVVSDHTSGVYFGWAGLSSRGIYKMVMSIGWNPYFDNTEKTVEPWLLHDFGVDFYGEELRLAVVGYIRPQANFPSLECLIERIHEDGKIAEKALDLPAYARYKDAPISEKSFAAAGKY